MINLFRFSKVKIEIRKKQTSLQTGLQTTPHLHGFQKSIKVNGLVALSNFSLGAKKWQYRLLNLITGSETKGVTQ